jgi:hypothetical protein
LASCVTEVGAPEDLLHVVREAADELEIAERLKAYNVELGGEARLVAKEAAP